MCALWHFAVPPQRKPPVDVGRRPCGNDVSKAEDNNNKKEENKRSEMELKTQNNGRERNDDYVLHSIVHSFIVLLSVQA